MIAALEYGDPYVAAEAVTALARLGGESGLDRDPRGAAASARVAADEALRRIS